MGSLLLLAAFFTGFARVDITPPLGAFMPGYHPARYAKSVLDPLEINMVAFSDGTQQAIVAQVDTVGISDAVSLRMRNAIAEATGVDPDAILLHASHTHDGACIRSGREDRRISELDMMNIEFCLARCRDAAVLAIRDLKPAKLSVGRSEAKRISFVRSYVMKDGKVQTNPGTGNPDIVRVAGNPPDETVQVLRIDREGGCPIALVNFQCHPDTVGGETVTADWPGLTRTVFEAATFGETRCLVVNGAQGDLNHCNVRPRPGEMNGLKRDFDAVDRGYGHARHMANVVAGAALSVWMKCVPLEAGPIRFGVERVTVPAQKAKDTDEKNLAWANEVMALHEAGRDDEISRKYGCHEMQLTTEISRANRIRRMASHPDVHTLTLHAVTIGRSVAFCGFPGEPFNDIGKAVKAKSPFALTVPACLTNGRRGYFPSAESYTWGGYETASSPFGPSVAADLVAGEMRLLKRLAKASRQRVGRLVHPPRTVVAEQALAGTSADVPFEIPSGRRVQLGFELTGIAENPVVGGRRFPVTLTGTNETLVCRDGRRWIKTRDGAEVARGDITNSLPFAEAGAATLAVASEKPVRATLAVTAFDLPLPSAPSAVTSLADEYVAAARRAYATEPYALYTNSIVRSYAGRVKPDERADVPHEGSVVNWVDVEGTRNFRDIGGWNGLKTGLVFRGAELNPRTDVVGFHTNLMATVRGLKTLQTIGIRTDLDLRGRGECSTPDFSPIPGARLVRVTSSAYTNMLRNARHVAEAMRVFADRRNYPVYFHCFGGADRTGTLAMLVEGLCGVSEADLSVDYELTSFGLGGLRSRVDKPYWFASAIRWIKRRPGVTFADKVADYLIREGGMTQAEIDSIRSILGRK